MFWSILKMRRLAASIRALHHPVRSPLRGSGLPRQEYPLRSMLWRSRCRRRKVLRSSDSQCWNCSQAMSDQSFCMATRFLRCRNFLLFFRKLWQFMEMVILAPVFVIGECLFEPRRIGQRIVFQFHGDGAASNDLSKENVKGGRHGNANAGKDGIRLTFDVIVNAKVDLNGCGGCFHAAYCTMNLS